jgi:serine protease
MPFITPSTRLVDPFTASPLELQSNPQTDFTKILTPSASSAPDFIGDTLQKAHNVGDMNGRYFAFSDSVNASDTIDLYRFKMESLGSVEVTLKGLSADADLYILDSQGVVVSRSMNLGTRDEFLGNGVLDTGIYYIRVNSFLSASTNYDLRLTVGGVLSDPGASLDRARDLGNISRAISTTTDFVGGLDTIDYHRFELSEASNFSLKITGLTSDIDVILYDRNGQSLATSNRYGNDNETISLALNAGTYYVRVYPWVGSSNYTLEVAGVSSKPVETRQQPLVGTLGADTFSLTANNLTSRQTVVSGNGNVDFGQGRWDLLDLSSLRSTDVVINLATATTGGMLYDPGNGSRLFDSIMLSGGNEILFEGIDRIQFADRTYTLSISPNDPRFGSQWNLHMMGVQNAWRFGTGSADVLIGVEDTGLGFSTAGQIHNDLRMPTYFDANNLADEFFREVNDEGYGRQYDSHGTSVQSIISAISNNGIGLSGINWSSPTYTIDALDGNTNDQNLATATQNMITEANRRGQRLVINLSLGGGPIREAFRSLVANNQDNALFVIASGNDDTNGLINPASLAIEYRNVVAVGASWGRTDRFGYAATPGDRISYPGRWGSNYGAGLTLMAPSEVIAAVADYSSLNGATFDYETGFNGTSAAAPNATGVASLVWSANRNLTAVQVQTILSQTTVDLGAAGYDNLTGHGMINADAAVRRALAIGRGATA